MEGGLFGWEGSEAVYISTTFRFFLILWISGRYVKTNNTYFMILSGYKSRSFFIIKENRNNNDYCKYTVLTSLDQMITLSRTDNE